eukprot:2004553-Pleurochrysis_carterae.AAC.2
MRFELSGKPVYQVSSFLRHLTGDGIRRRHGRRQLRRGGRPRAREIRGRTSQLACASHSLSVG